MLWLEAGKDACDVDGQQRVSRCLDLSVAGHDAFQPTISERPTLEYDVINGHATLRFQPVPEPGLQDDAQRLIVPDEPSLWLGTDDFFCVLVAAWGNLEQPRLSDLNVEYSGFGALITKALGARPYRGLQIAANYPSSYSTTPAWTRFAVQLDFAKVVAFSYSQGLNDRKFRVYATQRSGLSLSLRINGNPEGGSTLPAGLDISAAGSPLYIGGQRGQPLDGDIAEVILIRGASELSEISQLERHLMHKYAIDATAP